jgi:hypothetical protein
MPGEGLYIGVEQEDETCGDFWQISLRGLTP